MTYDDWKCGTLAEHDPRSFEGERDEESEPIDESDADLAAAVKISISDAPGR